MRLAIYFVALMSIGIAHGAHMPPPLASSAVEHSEQLKFQPNVYGDRADEEWRLPQHIQPVSYNIRLLPFFEDRDFLTKGYVEMIVNCVQATSNITFNFLDMIIDHQSVTVVRRDINLPINVDDIIEIPAYEKITVVTGTALVPGFQYIVSMNFSYFLSISFRGFFRTFYVENGVTKWMAATQFEAPSARKAFPCFDDPGMKAVFYITLGRQTSWTAVANTPVQQTIPISEEPGYVWDVFQASVKMPTYLVAFVVSELDFVVADPALSNVQFRIWARPDAINQTAYAAEVGPKVSEFFASYFEIDFPLPKQDMAAIPRKGGAMENWGLILYGESNLLYDPDVNTAAYKYDVAEVIAHEVAHQWTGNWVTCKWWNVIWLNEGFAQLMQYYGTDSAQPQFNPFEQFPVRTFQPTLVADSVPTRPINQPVSSPSESSAMFDTITYNKGACIIRMMADFLGDETFRRGMNLYLTRMAYGSAEQDDLFTALNDQATTNNVNLPVSVKTIMDTWTLQMGYPLITVNRDYANGSSQVTQERFLRVASNDTTEFKWWVPLTYRTTSTATTSTVWLSEYSTTVDFSALSNHWVLVNIDQKGYYRVKYDTVNYGLLRDQLMSDHQVIPVNTRSQLLDDAFNLAILSQISYTDAFDLTLYLVKEQSYSPWHGVLPELKYIESMFVNSSPLGDWKRYMTSLVTPFFHYIGFSETVDDEHLDILSRSNTIEWACKLGVPECTRNASEAFALWSTSSTDEEVISRNQKSIILCAGIQYGSEEDWEYAFQRLLDPVDPSEREAILNALTCTKTLWLQTRMLELMLNRTDGISASDGVSFFNGLAGNPVGNKVAFDFLRNRWDDLAIDYSVSMPGFFRTISAGFNTELQLSQLLVLRDEHLDILGNSGTVDQAIATVQENIKWMATNAEVIANWLKTH